MYNSQASEIDLVNRFVVVLVLIGLQTAFPVGSGTYRSATDFPVNSFINSCRKQRSSIMEN